MSNPELIVILELSLASITQCQAIEEAVMSRLRSTSPNVKWKSLRVIRHLCTNGHANMKKAFQRHNDLLRQCASTFLSASSKMVLMKV
jgi:uncharacterized protein with HEPN domain